MPKHIPVLPICLFSTLSALIKTFVHITFPISTRWIHIYHQCYLLFYANPLFLIRQSHIDVLMLMLVVYLVHRFHKWQTRIFSSINVDFTVVLSHLLFSFQSLLNAYPPICGTTIFIPTQRAPVQQLSLSQFILVYQFNIDMLLLHSYCYEIKEKNQFKKWRRKKEIKHTTSFQ